jgi:hypothetical protein
MQNTSKVLMIRPLHFQYNAETAVNNSFQVKGIQENLSEKAVHEFDELVSKLRSGGIEVTVVDDSAEPHTPDAIFPNNWISLHESGIYCLYPMFAPNRRMERKSVVMDLIKNKFHYSHLIDFTHYEKENRYLEGTGSMVLDRVNRFAYACLSPRTDIHVLRDFCSRMNFQPVVFHSTDEKGQSIYHTNVMMCVADRYVVVCLDSIQDPVEKKLVTDMIQLSKKEVVAITSDQMNHFAGNMLQLENDRKEKVLVMSSAAWASLETWQKEKLSTYNTIIHSSLKYIESNGGGSARCMIAELHI